MKILKTLAPYFIIIVAVLLVKAFILTPVAVKGTSMNPTLYENDILILTKFSYWLTNPKRFDIVIVDSSVNGKEMIKRVIGLPGEKIEYKDNKLYVNGDVVEENFDHRKTDDFTFANFPTSTKEKLLKQFKDDFADGEAVIPKGFYFVMGDNRTMSYDSRDYGFVSKNQIEGHASLVIWPVSRFGFR